MEWSLASNTFTLCVLHQPSSITRILFIFNEILYPLSNNFPLFLLPSLVTSVLLLCLCQFAYSRILMEGIFNIDSFCIPAYLTYLGYTGLLRVAWSELHSFIRYITISWYFCHTFCLSDPTNNEHLGYFHLLTSVNNAAVDTDVEISFWVPVLISFGVYLDMELLVSLYFFCLLLCIFNYQKFPYGF